MDREELGWVRGTWRAEVWCVHSRLGEKWITEFLGQKGTCLKSMYKALGGCNETGKLRGTVEDISLQLHSRAMASHRKPLPKALVSTVLGSRVSIERARHFIVREQELCKFLIIPDD